MKTYKNDITLAKNKRGCYILDTVKGCLGCTPENPKGCYGDCYAQNIAARYGFNFRETVTRDFKRDNDQLYLFGFKDQHHESDIIYQIKAIDMPFVRIGDMGDPSRDWEHTINICDIISQAGKPIVIITKHWKSIPNQLLPLISKLDICINTSVSALDDTVSIDYRIDQYNRLKPYCKSVLRVVTCDFNKETEAGFVRSEIQDRLLQNDNIIETVFRPSANNPLVKKGIIYVKKVKFLRSKVLASIRDESVYFGECSVCPDMCGIS
jgi:hypothetical protein